MFVTGPDVLKTVTHEDVSKEKLGGAMTHNSVSGVAHLLAHNDEDCLRQIRELMTFLPQNNLDGVQVRITRDASDRADKSLNCIIPPQSNKPYDIKDVITRVVDDANFFEIADVHPNIVIGFGHMAGETIGIVANQPAYLAGCLDIDSSTKAARFVDCDTFQIPILTFEDVPGFCRHRPKIGGIIRPGSRNCCTLMPKQPYLRLRSSRVKALAAPVRHRCRRSLSDGSRFTWPSAEIAVIKPKARLTFFTSRNFRSSEDAEQIRLGEK